MPLSPAYTTLRLPFSDIRPGDIWFYHGARHLVLETVEDAPRDRILHTIKIVAPADARFTYRDAWDTALRTDYARREMHLVERPARPSAEVEG